MTITVGELGESAVLERILAPLRPGPYVALGPGDDCAVLMTSGRTVVTTDTMIEGTDFRLDWHTPEMLGWKLAATNLSDVAAMGATPTALTVAISCPNDTPVAVLEGISLGLQEACDALSPGCSIAGGDLSRAPVMMVAVTALGEMEGREPVTRSGAKVGDTVAYAGELGLSRIGLRALFGVDQGAQHDTAGVSGSLTDLQLARAVRAQLAPVPPVGLAVDATRFHVTAMMDVSDGLSLDTTRLGKASGVTLDLHAEALLEGFGLQEGVPVSVTDLVLSGEDHGFLATFPAGAQLPQGFHPIGVVRERSVDLLLDGNPFTPEGWDPYAG